MDRLKMLPIGSVSRRPFSPRKLWPLTLAGAVLGAGCSQIHQVRFQAQDAQALERAMQHPAYPAEVASAKQAGIPTTLADLYPPAPTTDNAAPYILEIARRLKEKLVLSETRLDDAAYGVLEEFLSLSVPLFNASAALAGFASCTWS